MAARLHVTVAAAAPAFNAGTGSRQAWNAKLQLPHPPFVCLLLGLQSGELTPAQCSV